MFRHLQVIAVALSVLSWAAAQETDHQDAHRYPEGSGRYRKGPAGPVDTAGRGALGANQAGDAPPADARWKDYPEAQARQPKALAKAAAGNITVTPAATAIDCYRTLTVAINLAESYKNPYDPNDIRVDMLVTTPKGANLVQPCFFKSGNATASVWEARFTPREAGDHAYRIGVYRAGSQFFSDTLTVTARASNLDGFLHMDPTGSWYHFRYDSGKPFRGIGENFGWEDSKYTFEVMMDLMNKNKVNFFRTWKGPGMYYLEQSAAQGVGWINPDSAARIDKIMSMAEQYGMYLMPTQDPHIEYQTGVDYWGGDIKWQKNPYSTYKGGPCAKPIDFFTSNVARELYKHRLRYMIARWGASPYLGVIEFWNEVDWMNLNEAVPVQTIADWHDYMANYLRGIDPYNHVVTTSLSHNDFAPIWSLKNMDFSQRHLYGPTDGFITTLATYETEYKKPFVSGEFSFDWQGTTQHPHAQYAKELHLGLWRGMFLPDPILPLTWWWDFHADSGDYFHFARAREFSDKMLLNTQALAPATADAGTGDIEARALKSDKGVFVWLYNQSANNHGNVTVKLGGIANSSYDMESFDTWKGTWGNAVAVAGAGGQATFNVASLPAGSDVGYWLSDRVAVATGPRNILPDGFRADFDAASGRLILAYPGSRPEAAAYALADLRGRIQCAGRMTLPANAHGGRESVMLRTDHAEPGVYVLKVDLGSWSKSQRVVLSSR